MASNAWLSAGRNTCKCGKDLLLKISVVTHLGTSNTGRLAVKVRKQLNVDTYTFMLSKDRVESILIKVTSSSSCGKLLVATSTSGW